MDIAKETFQAAKVTEHVFWVGAIDWEISDFHGYRTGRGTTYNAYLILADKITLVDTVKKPFLNEMLSRIASVIDPKTIDYIISNHSEMDHSGCLPEIIDFVNPEKVFASPRGVSALSNHFHMDREIIPVKDLTTLNLGNLEVSFMETPMVHWPDSMFTYLKADQVLFSNDAFGMHLASSERFDDQLPAEILDSEAAKYYANILMPLSNVVAKTLDKVKILNLPIKAIATDHGPIWRKDIGKIINSYARWSKPQPSPKALIIYDTMWDSTKLMAHAIEEGIAAEEIDVKVMTLRTSHRSDVAAELLDAAALLVGSPTINNNIFPTLGDTLTYIKGLKPRGLIGAAFGSYGWSGEAVDQLNLMLGDMKVELISDGIKVLYVPDSELLKQCYSLGTEIAKKIKEKMHTA